MENETTENTTESTPTNTVANYVVLGFAVIGAVQTTKFAIRKVRDGVRYVKAVRAMSQPVETDEN